MKKHTEVPRLKMQDSVALSELEYLQFEFPGHHRKQWSGLSFVSVSRLIQTPLLKTISHLGALRHW